MLLFFPFRTIDSNHMKSLVTNAVRSMLAAALLSFSAFASAGPVNVDVVFLVDTSGSTTKTTFAQELALVSSIRSQFIALGAADDSANYRFGVIRFGATNLVRQHLDTAYDEAFVNATPYLGGSSYIKNAVQAGINMFDTEGDAGNIRQMFLFTDGLPSHSQYPAQLATAVKDAQIHMTAIGLPFATTTHIQPLVEDAQRDLVNMASYTANHTIEIHERLVAQAAEVPEPGTMSLVLLGIGAGCAFARRRAKLRTQQ